MEHNRVIYTTPYDSEVEYLESSGTQYIDTGIKASSDIGIYGTVNVTKDEIGSIFGARFAQAIDELHFLTKGAVGESSYIFGSSMTNKQQGSFNFLNKVVTISNLLQHHEFQIDTYTYTNQAQAFTCEYNILIYCMNNRGQAFLLLNGLRIYNFKIYNLDTLVRDFIPVRIGSVGYMYDKVSKQLFGNQGTGNFILGQDVANPVPKIRCVIYSGVNRCVMPMPYDSRVEYLKSNSHQYLDIGIIPKYGYRAICEYMPERTYTQEVLALFGQRANSQSNMFDVFMAFGTNVPFYAQYASYKSVLYVKNIPKTLHTIELGEKIYLDGNLLKTVTTTFNGDYTISIFAIHQNFKGSVNYDDRRMKDCRVYSFKLYNDSDTLIFDGIPVRRGTKGYMYDRVSGRLFGNLGTGNFIIGNDI